jgi:hypothetical protein
MKATVKETASKTAVKNYTPWEEIQEQYPDKFVLMKDLAFRNGLVIGGTVVYAHKDKETVCKKEAKLNISRTIRLYTGGIRGDIASKVIKL